MFWVISWLLIQFLGFFLWILSYKSYFDNWLDNGWSRCRKLFLASIAMNALENLPLTPDITSDNMLCD